MEGKGEAGGVCVPDACFPGLCWSPDAWGEPRRAGCRAGGARGEEGGGSKTAFQTVGRYVQPLTCFKIFHFLLPSRYPTVCYSPGKKQQDVGDDHRESTLEQSAEGNKVRSRVRDNAFL